jgi:hypothetical protein
VTDAARHLHFTTVPGENGAQVAASGFFYKGYFQVGQQ